jgi:hypothetical protein
MGAGSELTHPKVVGRTTNAPNTPHPASALYANDGYKVDLPH